MPRLAGRRSFYAALAVPIAMVIAPLTASAVDAGGAAVTEQAQSGAVVTENEAAAVADTGGFSDGPDWYVMNDADVVHNESEDTAVTYVVNGIHDDTVIGNSSEETTVVEDGDEDGDWHESDGLDVASSESETTNVTYVVNGIYNDSVVGNSSEETTVVEDDDDDFSPGPDWYGSNDLDVAYSESETTNVTYVVNGIHNDTVIGNSSEESTYLGDGFDEHNVYHHDAGTGGWDDDSSSTYFEEVSVGAGTGGAWFDSVESGSYHLD